jgi:Tfp pilus assembly protein PilX
MMKTHLKLIRQERGSTLVVYMFVLAAMAAVAIASLQTITLNLETAHSHKKGRNAFYSAEVGLDLAVNDIVSEFEDLTPYTESADDGSADGDGYINVADYRNYAVKYKITNPLESFLYQTVVGNTIIYHYAHSYDIEAESTSNQDSSRETVNEQIRILETPLVQYYVFYGQDGNSADLELFPGPDMNSWGRIHSNADIYIGSSSGNTITLRNYDASGNLSPHSMTATGSIYTKKKNNSNNYANTVEVKTSGTGTTFTPAETLTDHITSSNEVDEEIRFENYVLVNEEAYTTPSKDLFDRGGFYEQRSLDPQKTTVDGLTILGTGGLGAGNIEVTVSRPSSTDVTALVLAGESSTGVPIAGLPMPIIQESVAAFGDCREDDRDVDTTDIDLYALGLWYEAYLADQGLTLAGDGMLIYTSRSPDSTFTNHDDNLQAIRLMEIDSTSSPQLSDETTLATDNPIYVQGDFNTVNTSGVALIGDAMNILSNAFTTKACGSYSSSVLKSTYPASTTSVYAAIFAGHVPTGADGSHYSGGLHTYPRLHEYWTQHSGNPDVTLEINGSFINLWDSEQADGYWCLGGDCYSGPTRNWGWDVRFQDPDFWPPFIPSIFSIERVGFLE